jgi:hypothetical protein
MHYCAMTAIDQLNDLGDLVFDIICSGKDDDWSTASDLASQILV